MRKHHPHTRAERLALKELDVKQKDQASKVRRKVLESFKDQETENELREFQSWASHDKNHRVSDLLIDPDLLIGDSAQDERAFTR